MPFCAPVSDVIPSTSASNCVAAPRNIFQTSHYSQPKGHRIGSTAMDRYCRALTTEGGGLRAGGGCGPRLPRAGGCADAWPLSSSGGGWSPVDQLGRGCGCAGAAGCAAAAAGAAAGCAGGAAAAAVERLLLRRAREQRERRERLRREPLRGGCGGRLACGAAAGARGARPGARCGSTREHARRRTNPPGGPRGGWPDTAAKIAL